MYAHAMRVVLAALLAALLVVITTADRLLCPDGCTDDAPVQATVPQHASAPCALCQGWNPSPVTRTPSPAASTVSHPPLRPMARLAPARPAIERPPKAA